MTLHSSRRAFAAGLIATTTVPSIVFGQLASPEGFDNVQTLGRPAEPAEGITEMVTVAEGEPLDDFAEFWSRLPLPFTPAEAWRRLPAKVQEELGAALIGFHLAEYIAGDDMAEADQFLDERLRIEAMGVQGALLNSICPRLWELFPTLYGPDGDHPRWALDGGLAR